MYISARELVEDCMERYTTQRDILRQAQHDKLDQHDLELAFRSELINRNVFSYFFPGLLIINFNLKLLHK